MNIWDKEFFEVVYQNKKYTVTKLEIDISESWDKPKGTVEITNKIEVEGSPSAFYLISDYEESSIGFGHKVIEDDSDHGLFVTLQDEEMFEQLANLVGYVEETYNE